MHLERLHLICFRNYQELEVDFAPSRNVIFGDNGEGKTNLLEAVYLLFTGRSFRTHHLLDLAHLGQREFCVRADFVKHGISQSLQVQFDGQKRRVVYNDTSYASANILLGLMQGVLFAPGDTSLIRGAPQERRTFLDLQNAQVDPLYVHHLQRYQKALKQRNALLKQRQTSYIEPFEEEMAKSGAYLCLQRQQTVEQLRLLAPIYYRHLSGLDADTIDFFYKTDAPLQEGFEGIVQHYQKEMVKNRQREEYLGMTLVGPHREDMLFFLKGGEAKKFASEGQVKSIAAALRLAEWALLKERADAAPLMLIDDLAASLDSKRQRHLLDLMADLGQVFITTVDAAPLKRDSDRLFILKEGRLS
ncbi:MAG: recF [Chlamydiales bacterium]|nr:recF [Chlamydiales bacterium]